MTDLARSFPPPPTHPLYARLEFEARLEAERDLAIRAWTKEVAAKRPSFILTRMEGGSGFPLSNILRTQFLEYASRIWTHGPHSFPTSFNVVESFLIFSHDFFAFDIRPEIEHLLRLSNYIDWYTSGAFPDNPHALMSILREGTIYSYNFSSPLDDFHLQTGDSDVVLQGVSLVRHSTELSILALAGEDPPTPPSDAIGQTTVVEKTVGKEKIEPAPDLTSSDRYLPELPGYGRVAALARIDLSGRNFIVRYVNRDVGKSWDVQTDDPVAFGSSAPFERELYLKHAAEELKRYRPLLASIATLLYLPAFYVDRASSVVKTKFRTALSTQQASAAVRKARQRLGPGELINSREVNCMKQVVASTDQEPQTIAPPELGLAREGFWKKLPPGDVGEDELGNPVMGKTWVERTEAWSSVSPDRFLMETAPVFSTGPDPGSIYVMRSPAHVADLYKIGLTRRNPIDRAKELSRPTSSPAEFDVLAKWEVGDVRAVEANIHARLARYRVSKRREFFRVSLATIVSEVNSILKTQGQAETGSSDEGVRGTFT